MLKTVHIILLWAAVLFLAFRLDVLLCGQHQTTMSLSQMVKLHQRQRQWNDTAQLCLSAHALKLGLEPPKMPWCAGTTQTWPADANDPKDPWSWTEKP